MKGAARKFLFFHIPKCAGRSVKWTLNEYFDTLGKRLMSGLGPRRLGTAQRMMEVFKELQPPAFPGGRHGFEGFFKFTFTRNPWDRAVSCWKYHSAAQKYKTFKEYLDAYPYCNSSLDWHSFPQWRHICDGDGKQLVDFIGSFENLQEDFNTVCDKIGIPRKELAHRNKSEHKHYTEYYNDSLRNQVGELFKRDIEMFGYKFEE